MDRDLPPAKGAIVDSERSDDLKDDTDVPYVPNIKPVIVPMRIGSNVVNLGGDAEAEIKSTIEADAEKKKRSKRKKGQRFGGNGSRAALLKPRKDRQFGREK